MYTLWRIEAETFSDEEVAHQRCLEVSGLLLDSHGNVVLDFIDISLLKLIESGTRVLTVEPTLWNRAAAWTAPAVNETHPKGEPGNGNRTVTRTSEP